MTVTFPGGLRACFIKGARKAPREVLKLSLSQQRRLGGLADFESWVDEARRETGTAEPVVSVWNNGGSWLEPAAWSSRLGLSTIYVCQAAASDEIDTDSRVVLTAEESDLCFLPNYKCGYSSVRRLYRGTFSSCAAKAQAAGNVTSALNVRLSMEGHPSRFKFSIVRDPVDRFASFYLDKLCQRPERPNAVGFFKVYEALVNGPSLSPRSVLAFIRTIPPAFADRHWKSTYSNLFFEGCPLVHRIYGLEALDLFIEDAGAYLGREVELPHLQRSGDVVASEAREALSEPTFRDEVQRVYARDVELHRLVVEAGGRAGRLEIGEPRGAAPDAARGRRDRA